MNKETIHKNICDLVHATYVKKNADYGDSFSQLRKRYPEFICMRVFDKLNRLENCMKPGYECKVSDETVEDTLLDIANYCIMEVTERRAEQSATTIENEIAKVITQQNAINYLVKVLDQIKHIVDMGCENTSCDDCPLYRGEKCAATSIYNVVFEELDRIERVVK